MTSNEQQTYSVRLDAIIGEIKAEIVKFGQDESFRNILLSSLPGGGKTHLLKILEDIASTAAGENKILPVYLSPETASISCESELSVAIARRVGFAGSGGSLKDIAELLRHSHEKALLLLEKPETFFCRNREELYKSIIEAGIMVISAGDAVSAEQLPDSNTLKLPVLSLSDAEDLLIKQGLEEGIVKQITAALELCKFINITPKLVFKLEKICRLHPHDNSELLFFNVLDSFDDLYNGSLAALSPQQKNIIISLGKADALLLPRELSEDAGFDIPVINAQLKRLRDAGILKEISTEDSGRTCHYFADPLLHLWLYRKYHRSEIPFIGFIGCLDSFKKYKGRPSQRFFDYVKNEFLALFQPQCQVEFLLSPEAFPAYPYEGLTKTVVSYIRGGDYRRAETIMEAEAERSAAAGLKERSARALLFAGIARTSISNYESAKSAFKEASVRGEKSPLLWINYGVLYYLEGNILNARNCFQQAVKTPEKFPQAYSNLGAVLLAGGELNMAEDAFLRALKLKEDYFPAIIGLANTHFLWQETETARKMYEDAVKLAPENLTVLKNSAFLAFLEGNNTLCIKYCAKIAGDDREILRLSIAAELADTLKQTAESNFGHAGKSFIEACGKINVLGEQDASKLFTVFFTALAGLEKYAFWLELYSIIDTVPFAHNLKLLKAFVEAKTGNSSEAERILPMEKDYFEEIQNM